MCLRPLRGQADSVCCLFLREARLVTPKERMAKSQRGQIVVEYLLLLIVVVTAVSIVVRFLVQRTEGPEGGAIIRIWNDMLQTIATDKADEV